MRHRAWAPFLVNTGMKGSSGLGVASNGRRGARIQCKQAEQEIKQVLGHFID